MPIDHDALRQIREALGVTPSGFMDVDGDALKAFRETAGFSQRQLADAVGLTESWLSKLETGARHRASSADIARIAVLLGVEPDELSA